MLLRFSFLLCVCGALILYSVKWLKRFGWHRWIFAPLLMCGLFLCQQFLLRLKGDVAGSYWFYCFSWVSSLLFGLWAMFMGLAFFCDVVVAFLKSVRGLEKTN